MYHIKRTRVQFFLYEIQSGSISHFFRSEKFFLVVEYRILIAKGEKEHSALSRNCLHPFCFVWCYLKSLKVISSSYIDYYHAKGTENSFFRRAKQPQYTEIVRRKAFATSKKFSVIQYWTMFRKHIKVYRDGLVILCLMENLEKNISIVNSNKKTYEMQFLIDFFKK